MRFLLQNYALTSDDEINFMNLTYELNKNNFHNNKVDFAIESLLRTLFHRRFQILRKGFLFS